MERAWIEGMHVWCRCLGTPFVFDGRPWTREGEARWTVLEQAHLQR